MKTIRKSLIWFGYLFALACMLAWFFVGALHLLFFAVGACLLSKSLETDKIMKEMTK